MRKKASAYEKELKAASSELGLPKNDWRTEKLATLTLMFLVSRSKWASGQASNHARDMLDLMNEITALRASIKAVEPTNINVKFVKGYHGIANVICPHCGVSSRHEVSDKPFDKPESRPPEAHPEKERTTGRDSAIAAPSSGDQEPQQNQSSVDIDTQPAANVVPLTVAFHREGVSASPTHSAVLSNGEVPPLKKFQPDIYATRSVSPMSQDPRPRPLQNGR